MENLNEIRNQLEEIIIKLQVIEEQQNLCEYETENLSDNLNQFRTDNEEFEDEDEKYGDVSYEETYDEDIEDEDGEIDDEETEVDFRDEEEDYRNEDDEHCLEREYEDEECQSIHDDLFCNSETNEEYESIPDDLISNSSYETSNNIDYENDLETEYGENEENEEDSW